MFELAAPPQNPWAVQVLTTDYLIDGWLDGLKYRQCFNVVSSFDLDILLTSTRVQPTGPMPPLAEPVAPWTQVFGASVVALIPRDDASLSQAMKENAAWRIAVRAEACVGNYVFRGAFLSPDKRLRVLIGFKGFVAQDVEIECRLAGAQMAPFKAPYAVVVTQHRQLLRPLA